LLAFIRIPLAEASHLPVQSDSTHDVVEVSSKDTFAIEAWLYRNLEVNCRQKANMAEEAAAEQKRRFGSQP
jgi:hypothetical protein